MLGAVLGALSPGAATGHDIVDAIYRAAFVAAVTLAGSRSRRWSLVFGAGIVAIFGVGLGQILGIAALAGAGYAAWKDFRNRLVGASLGAVISLAALRLGPGPFLGSTVVLGTLAVVPLMWSGYKISSRAARRNVRRGIAAIAVIFIAGFIMAGIRAATSVSTLRTSATDLRNAVDAASDGDTEAATDGFTRAQAGFASVESGGSILLSPARLIPIAAQNMAVVEQVSSAGADLSAAAAELTSSVDYDAIRRDGGGVDLAVLESISGPVARADDALNAAGDTIDGLAREWLLPPLATRVDELDDKVTDYGGQTRVARIALDHAPALLGAGGERRYLVLLGNPAELRDLGGHLGNWAELTIADGAINLTEVGRPSELSQPQLDAAVADDANVPESMVGLQPARYPQNWSGSLDFSLVAQMSSRLFTAATGRSVDGVLYADPHVVSALLAITGPVEAPGLGRTIGSGDVVGFLTKDQFADYGTDSEGDDAVTEFIETVFERFQSSTLPGPRSIGDTFSPLVHAGRLRMISFHDDDQPLLDLTGLSNTFDDTVTDYLAVVNRNANPSKIDAYLTRDNDYRVLWNPATGEVTATVTVTLRNTAPATGLPDVVIGNGFGAPWGTNRTDLAVITPLGLKGVSVDNAEVGAMPLVEGRGWRHTVRVDVPAGGERTVRFELKGRLQPARAYDLFIAAQPTLNPGSTNVTITSTDGSFRPADGLDVLETEATTTVEDLGEHRLSAALR